MISERMRARRAREWLSLLEPSGVPCGPINDLAQVFADPQVMHRGMQVKVPHPAAGEMRMVASPMKFSDTPIPHDAPPPTLGQHTDEILERILGLTSDRIAGLRARGVL
jgi:crotonobetainyl-CoA:carnitine CoA-transferase CaiB-like acyl-CoA transferase